MYINGTYMEIGKIASKDGRVYFDLDNSELRCDRIVSESTDSTNANIVGFIGSTYLRSLDGNYSTVNGFTVYNTKNEPGLIAITPGDSSGSKPKISADQSGLAIYSRVPYSQMGSSGVAGISTSNNGYVLLYGGRGRIPTDSNIEGADSNIGGAYIMITPESYKSGSNIYTLSNIYVRGHTYFSGTGVTMSGLEVTGPKSRIVDTEDYGTRALYCYEMPSPMFGDIGEAWLDENGEYYGYLDDIFTETIRTDIEYQVFLQKEGKGDIWVDSKEPAFFVVKGTPGLKFSWEVKAKQIGFEFERLENREVSEMEQLDLDAYDSVYLEELNRVIGEQEGLLYETAW